MNKLTFKLHIIRLYLPHMQVAGTKDEIMTQKKKKDTPLIMKAKL